MKFSIGALLSLGLVTETAAAGCSANCLPDMVGGPYTCDELVDTWNLGNNASAWDGHLKEITCPALEEFNCCDCTDCLCNTTDTTTTVPETTTTTTLPECHLCWGYMFGGESGSPAESLNEDPGYQNQFFDVVNSNTALDLHVRMEGCEAAALNGLDCSNCGCFCGDPVENVDCVQDGPTCGECSVTECGLVGTRDCEYDTTEAGSGLGQQCNENFQIPCFTDPCIAITESVATELATTTISNVVNCSEPYLVDGVNVLDVEIIFNGGVVNLGGSCDTAKDYVYCSVLSDTYGADCFDDCQCQCDPGRECNSRPFWDNDDQFAIFDGECYPRTRCDDPCTEYIGYPEFSELNHTCEELLQTNEMSDLDTLFATFGESNYCNEFKCCQNFTSGGGIPVNEFNMSVYECYQTTTTTTTMPPTTTTTTGECEIPIVTDSRGDNWTSNALIGRGLSCYQIASAIYGFEDVTTLATGDVLESLTYYPIAPPNVDAFNLAQDCGCVDSCEDSCDGCNALFDALEYAGFDLNSGNYFCSDIEDDFNMDCSGCGCSFPDACDDKILFASNSSKNSNNALYDISCNQLHMLGLNCDEIESYTALHGLSPNPCSACDCTETTSVPFCDLPCGGGTYGTNSSTGFLNESQFMSCNDFIQADLSCAVIAETGCTGCEVCGCVEENITTTEQTCDTDCNSLSVSCSDLVAYFTCEELENEAFDGCGCADCGCVDSFTAGTCGTGCMEGQSCDDWVNTPLSGGRYFYTCENLESDYGCDCSDCECPEFTTSPPPTGDCATTTVCFDMDCQTVSDLSGLNFYELEEEYDCDCTGCPGCNPTGCEDASCDDWQAAFQDGFGAPLVTCETLEESFDGCDCHGCACEDVSPPPSTETIGCQQTCDQLDGYLNTTTSLTCDDLRAMENTLTCAYMETFYACDCSGCFCEQVPDGECVQDFSS